MVNNQTLAAQNDAVIKVGFQLQQTKLDMRGALAGIDKQIAQAKGKLNSAMNSTYPINKHVTRGVQEKKALLALESQRTSIANGFNDVIDDQTGKQSKLQNVMAKSGNEMKRTSVQFKGYAMSIMFFGMALQKISAQVKQFSTKAFREINESVDGSTNKFMELEGSMKYLGFTMGAALEPIANALIPIIDAISEWVSNNPGLARTSFLFLSITGTLAAVFGAAALAASGFLELGLKLGIVKLNSDGVIKSIAGISKVKLKGAWTSTLNGLKDSLKWIKANPIKTLSAAGAVTGIIIALGWINRLQKGMGGWGEFGKNVIRGFLNTWALVPAALYAAKKELEDFWNARKGKQTSGLSYKDHFGNFMDSNQDDYEEWLGPPIKGYVEDTRTLAEIWKGDIYPEIDAANAAMAEMGATMDKINNMSFSDSGIDKLWNSGLLENTDNIGALLYGDTKNDNLISDRSTELLEALLQSKGTNSSVLIQELTVNSDADNIEAILDSLKSYT